MLKPAQLYKEQLEEKEVESWYDLKNIFFHGWAGATLTDLADNNYECHAFVSVDSNEDIIGYISYAVDWSAMSADRFCMISYQKGNLEFVKDLWKVICDLFEVYHMNRIEWYCYADNPAIRGYRNFIKKHGGRECGYRRQTTKLMDGKLHDSVIFEIMADEFHR